MPDDPISRRPSLPKGLRFEVFKRDKFTCQYCGRKAPDVLLHVDHIHPRAEGGGEEIVNLVTSCIDCNLGKGDRRLDDNSVVEKSRRTMEELEDRRQQLEMLMLWHQGLRELGDEEIDRLLDYWYELAPGWTANETGCVNLKKWRKKFSLDEIIHGMNVAASLYLQFDSDGNATSDSWDAAWKKVPGVCGVERDSKEDPDLKDLLYVRGIVKNRCDYAPPDRILDLLREGRSVGVPMATLRELAKKAKCWSHWRDEMMETIANFADPNPSPNGNQ